MDGLAQVKEGYRVEVSGWDRTDAFFVEKTTVAWHGDAQKTISLYSTLREGCVVFVRLVPSLANENYFPIAYQAVNIEDMESDGRTRASLVPVWPRTPFKSTSEPLE